MSLQRKTRRFSVLIARPPRLPGKALVLSRRLPARASLQVAPEGRQTLAHGASRGTPASTSATAPEGRKNPPAARAKEPPPSPRLLRRSGAARLLRDLFPRLRRGLRSAAPPGLRTVARRRIV